MQLKTIGETVLSTRLNRFEKRPNWLQFPKSMEEEALDRDLYTSKKILESAIFFCVKI